MTHRPQTRSACARRKAVGDLGSDGSYYDWCQSIVRVYAPNVVPAIERLQADSKFFRSLVLILPAACLVSAFMGAAPAAWSAFVATVFAGTRFLQLRWKATDRVYEFFLNLMKNGASISEGTTQDRGAVSQSLPKTPSSPIAIPPRTVGQDSASPAVNQPAPLAPTLPDARPPKQPIGESTTNGNKG